MKMIEVEVAMYARVKVQIKVQAGKGIGAC